MFTKQEQRSWIKIEVAQGHSTQECFQGLHDACGDAVFLEGRQGCRSGQSLYRMTVHGEQHSSTPCFPVGCWSPIDCVWVSSESRSMSQNCTPHSARHSGLPQTCSALDNLCYVWGATMAPLCSRTGLNGPVPKGRWWLSWTNYRYGRNLTSHISTMGRKFTRNTIHVSKCPSLIAVTNGLMKFCNNWKYFYGKSYSKLKLVTKQDVNKLKNCECFLNW